MHFFPHVYQSRNVIRAWSADWDDGGGFRVDNHWYQQRLPGISGKIGEKDFKSSVAASAKFQVPKVGCLFHWKRVSVVARLEPYKMEESEKEEACLFWCAGSSFCMSFQWPLVQGADGCHGIWTLPDCHSRFLVGSTWQARIKGRGHKQSIEIMDVLSFNKRQKNHHRVDELHPG